MPDLWTDLDAESRKPGPTMTITKAQYATLRAALDEANGLLMVYRPVYEAVVTELRKHPDWIAAAKETP
jgi:hypothetical protein